jgi:hypothetical protein
VTGGSAKTEGGTAVNQTVPVDEATSDEAVLPECVQEALGQLVGAAKEGLLALSVEVGLGVLRELLEQEVEQLLRKAIRQVFGNDVPVQRCVQHKLRNVVAHLPRTRPRTGQGKTTPGVERDRPRPRP